MSYNPEYHAAYYQANKDKKRKQGRLWAKNNPDKVKASKEKQRLKNPEALKAARIKWEQNNPEKVLYKAARARAKIKNLEFAIDVEDIVIPSHCPLLGIELISGINGVGLTDASPTLDRIDSFKGYIKGNVWIISALANRIKTNATPEQIMEVAVNLQKLLKRKDG